MFELADLVVAVWPRDDCPDKTIKTDMTGGNHVGNEKGGEQKAADTPNISLTDRMLPGLFRSHQKVGKHQVH